MKTEDFLKLIDKYEEHEYNRLCDLRVEKQLYPKSYPNAWSNSVELNHIKITNAIEVLKLYIDKQLKYTTKQFLFIKSQTKYKDFSLFKLEQSKLVSKTTIEIANTIIKLKL